VSKNMKLKPPRPYRATPIRPKNAEYISVGPIYRINNKVLALMLNRAFACGWKCRELGGRRASKRGGKK
jgi:hypothetical protein